jgi:RNA polymerase sigma factor (TIGR02999 family)
MIVPQRIAPVGSDDPNEITNLLRQAQAGDDLARDAVMERLYGELHQMAQRYAHRERRGHTLQPTAIVNEVYIRLFGTGKVHLQDRAHFLAVSARQMRRVLVDYARGRNAAKRGAGVERFTLEDFDGPQEVGVEELLAVDLALEQLQQHDGYLAQLVELKYFGGLTDHEIAEALHVSFAQVRRDWAFARAWLRRRLESPPKS